jgi:hypothetical protein
MSADKRSGTQKKSSGGDEKEGTEKKSGLNEKQKTEEKSGGRRKNRGAVYAEIERELGRVY